MEGQTPNGAGNFPQHDHEGEVDLKSIDADRRGRMMKRWGEESSSIRGKKENRGIDSNEGYRTLPIMFTGGILDMPNCPNSLLTYREEQCVVWGGVPVICI